MSKERDEERERQEARQEHCREIARLGGTARMSRLSADERREIASRGGYAARDARRQKYTEEQIRATMRERGRKGAAARWGKKEGPGKGPPQVAADATADLGW